MASKKFNELPPLQQGLLLALLPAILVAVVLYSFVLPLRKQAAVLNRQVTTLRVQNQRGRLLMAQRAQLQHRLSQAQSELATLRQIVPDQPADDQFVAMVYATALAAAVHIRDLVAGQPARQTYYTAMPFQAHLDGTYFSMLNFFSRLATIPRIVNVADLSLGPPKLSGGMGTYTPEAKETVAANCTLTTFYNSPPPTPPPGKPGVKAGR